MIVILHVYLHPQVFSHCRLHLYSPSKNPLTPLITFLDQIPDRILPSSSTAHRLLVPGEGKHDDTCQDQTNSDSSVGQEGFIQCDDSCSKRKLCENDLSMKRFNFSNERRGLEELYFSPQSLQLMLNDGLIYIDDLVKVFLVNPSEFHRILAKRYHVQVKQAILTSKIIEQWWENIQQ